MSNGYVSGKSGATGTGEMDRPVPKLKRKGPRAKLDAAELWEWLYGELRGNVPDQLTDRVLADLAKHINKHFVKASP